MTTNKRTSPQQTTSVATQLKRQLRSITQMSELLTFFDIGFDRPFVQHHGKAIYKRFNGHVLQQQPDDWFDYRRCLKRAYCHIQRHQMRLEGRVTCHGCTSCDRR